MKIETTDKLKDTAFLLRLSSDQHRQLKQFADKNKIKMSQAVRLILADYIGAKGKG